MVSLADSLVSSAQRPLKLRVRPDLKVRRHKYQGRPFWVVKEPIGLKYYRFQEEEFSILQMLDGNTSYEDLKNQFEAEFAPQRITLQDLQHFIGMLHRSGLVISDASGQGRQLQRRSAENSRRELMGKLSNVLAIRFKGIDPERLLNWLYPIVGWFFSFWFFCCVIIMALVALSLVTVQYDMFRTRLPAFHEFFGPSNWFYLGITLGLTKVLHEFGHGLSCKHFGGECHEMGVMFLVLTPCLYCNVSDSWLLPNKWHRAAIGAAGMYVEVFLASVATFLWWFSEPGLLNHICLSIMFVCSVSTILFNGNPLLRFDGYYILSDIAEIPNLRQKSSKILGRLAQEYCLGIEQQEDPFLPDRHLWFFALYTTAATVYRWVVVFSILFFLNAVLEPYGLKVIGQAIGLMGLFGLLVQPVWNMIKFFRAPGRMSQVKSKNLSITVAIIAAFVSFVCFVKLPFSVKCAVEVKPSQQKVERVIVKSAGQLKSVNFELGDEVEEGQVIAELEDIALELQYQETLREYNSLYAQWKSLSNDRKRMEGTVTAEIRRLDQAVRASEEALAILDRRRDWLKLRAPLAGTVMPPPEKKPDPKVEGRLPTWDGSLMRPKNLGARVEQNDVLCMVGDPTAFEAMLIIDQSDLPFVSTEMNALVRLDAYVDDTFEGKIEAIAASDMEVASPSMSTQAGGRMALVTDASGVQRPQSASYEALVPLQDLQQIALRPGMRGRAKIKAEKQTLISRLWRVLNRTFHLSI